MKKLKKINKKHYPIKQIPYASFIIDEPPKIIDNTNKPVQLSFDEIIKDKIIKPVKHRSPLNYTDVCPHCSHKLYLHHECVTYDVLVCNNDNCKFYLKNKALLQNNQAEHLKTNTINTNLIILLDCLIFQWI